MRGQLYNVTVTVNDANYQGSTAGTLVIGKATAQVALGSLSQSYTGTALSASATTNPSGLTVSLTYNGSAGAPTAAGSYTVVGTIQDANYQGSATGTLVIGKAAATVALGGLSQTYTGTPLSASAITNPAGLNVAFTYGGNPTAPTAAGSYTTVAAINDANYQGSATGTLVIGKVTASVSWSAPAAISYGTALTSTQLNASTTVPGSFVYSPALGTVLPEGNQTLTVQFTPADTTDYASTSATVHIVVNSATLTLTANSATRAYGTANPAFTGAMTGQQGSDIFTESFASTATVSSLVGTYAIVPSVSGTNLADYTQSAANGTLTIIQAASSTTLTASSNSISPGQPVTLSAQVVSATTGTPTGMASFYDGATLLGAAQLVSGQATFTTATLSSNTIHSLSASYAGDGNFNASATASSVNITLAALDFTMTIAGPSNASIQPGQSMTYQMTVTPNFGAYAGTVSFAISGLPAGATATFSPATIAANSGPQMVMITIQTASATALHQAPGTRHDIYAAGVVIIFFGMGLFRRRSKALPRLLAVLLLTLSGALLVSGCGSSGGFFGTAPQSYTVTITATSASLTHTTNVTLNVQ